MKPDPVPAEKKASKQSRKKASKKSASTYDADWLPGLEEVSCSISSSSSIVQLSFINICPHFSRGIGIGGLMRGMATLPQANQELLVVRDKVGRPQVSLG